MTCKPVRLVAIIFAALIVSSSVGGAALANPNGGISQSETAQLQDITSGVDEPFWNKNPEKGNEKPDKGSSPENGNGKGKSGTTAPTGKESNEVVVPQERRSARHYRNVAVEHLEAASSQSNGKQLDRSLSELETTYTYHLDRNRTTSAAVFRADHEIASSVLRDAPDATGALIAADREFALQALADAERTQRALDERNLSYNRSAVAGHLSESRRAINQARHVQAQSPRPVAAIEHYRHAWTAAQRALDVMDEDVQPQIELTTAFDFPHNESVTRTVNGTVFDVRPHELSGTLRIDNDTDGLGLVNTTTPATVIEFNRTVELGPQTQNRTHVYTVSVTVSDPGHDVADRSYEPEDRLDHHQPQSSTATVGFDGDGLTHGYEAATTGTDPFDPDSNSSETSTNESNNGVLDGLEDFDADTVATFYEMQSGTDPLDPDTDGDRLEDGFELRINALDATNSDTDGDGTPDAREDLDGEGLTALGEQRNGTSPELVDTDLDRLSDAEEVFEYGTDPVAPDTDEDGLLDGEEIELGTDPLVADTDGDGVLDGNETYTTARTNESLGATVAVDGKGNAAKSVTVEANDEPALNNSAVNGARASDIVRIDARTAVESANVTLDYDPSSVSNESDAAVFRFDRDKQTFVELNSTVDTETNTVSGSTDSFGTFVVLEESTWAAQFADPLPSNWSVTENFTEPGEWTCEGENDPTCDTSGDGVTVGQGSSKTASITTSETSENESFSIQCIPTGDGECIPVTDSDGDGTIDYFDDCPNTPGTDSGCPQDSDGDGVNDIDDDCPNEAGSGSDGCPTGGYDPDPPDDDPGAEDPNEPIDEGQEATNSTFGRSLTFRDAEEIVVEAKVAGEATGERSQAMFVIVDEELGVTRLFNVEGTGEDGTQNDAQTVRRDLSEFAGETVAFRLVALNDSTVTLQSMRISYDTDGDGLADSVEKAGIRTGYRGTLTTDPHSADTDGDGLTDGEEVGTRSLYDYGRYFRINSNPTMADTDLDGLSDDSEAVWKTDPFKSDTDRDGYNDLVDSNPLVENNAPSVELRSEKPTKKIIGGSDTVTDYSEHLVIRTSDESRIGDVSVNGTYNPLIGDRFTEQSTPRLVDRIHTGGPAGYTEVYEVNIYQHGAFDEPPKSYYVNVTDEHGNKVSLKIKPREETDGSGGLASAATASVVVVGGTGATAGGTGAGAGVVGLSSTGIGLVLVGGVALVGTAAVYHDYNQPVSGYEATDVYGRQELVVPNSRPVATIPAHENPLDVPLQLPSGYLYESPSESWHDRGSGWEYIKRTPGIISEEDIGSVLRTPSAIRQDGEYTVVIGDNPSGQGKIAVRLLEGIVVSASHVITDPQGRDIEITDDVINKIVYEKDDWDHNQIGNNEEQVRENLREIIKAPAEIYKEPGQDRWMYIKRMVLNGKPVIVVLFVVNGKVATAFVPTEKHLPGEVGYSDEWAKYYVLLQEMVKKYADENTEILPEIGIGEQAEKPDETPTKS